MPLALPVLGAPRTVVFGPGMSPPLTGRSGLRQNPLAHSWKVSRGDRDSIVGAFASPSPGSLAIRRNARRTAHRSPNEPKSRRRNELSERRNSRPTSNPVDGSCHQTGCWSRKEGGEWLGPRSSEAPVCRPGRTLRSVEDSAPATQAQPPIRRHEPRTQFGRVRETNPRQSVTPPRDEPSSDACAKRTHGNL